MKTKMLYLIVVIVILAVVLLGFVYFSPVGNMMCGPCGCRNEDCGGGSCVPYTCTQLGKNCGSWSNGCGGNLSCGTCPSGKPCNNGVCCTPKTCAQLGKQCGSWSDGCGGYINCGTCSIGYCSNGTCVACNCTVWINGACGMPFCAGGQRLQTRTCSPSGCDIQTRCIADSACIFPNSCTDSDGGIKPFIAGNVSGYWNSTYYSFVDICFANGSNILTEYYCNGNQSASIVIQNCTVCPVGAHACTS